MEYKASSKEDLHALVVKIESLNPEQTWKFVSKVHSQGLMKIRPVDLPEFGITEEAFGKILNQSSSLAYDTLFAGLSRTAPDELTAFSQQTCQHLLFGNDTEENTSVGGFSQRELNILVDILENL